MDSKQNISLWLKQKKDAMVEQLLTWCKINSGTFNQAGLNRMTDVIQEDFTVLGAKTERIKLSNYVQIDNNGNPAATELGALLSFVKRPEAPIQILLCGHMDTVYPADSSFQNVKFLDVNKINGPGVADMKGGLLVMLYALQAIEQFADVKNIGWRVMINPDEEIGSPASAEYIKKWAPNYHYGLAFEPSLTPDGVFAGQRKGSGNFTLVVHGKAAHVGRAFTNGKNALVGLAHLIEAINALNNQREGVTINIGYCHGGGALNMVPDLAIGKLNIRTQQLEDETWFNHTIEKILKNFRDQYDMQVEWHGSYSRSPKILDAKQLTLYHLLQKTAENMGIKATWQATGGCSDGNNLAAAGLPNVDTLGVRGGAIHSQEEFMLVDSLTERAELTAQLILNCKDISHANC
jgi:glutamate carboxypeptidase